MLELWGMRSILSLLSLLGPLWSLVVAPDRALSMGQIEINFILLLNWIAWNKTVFDVETVYSCWIKLFEIELFLERTKLFTYAKLNYLKQNYFALKLCTYPKLKILKENFFLHLTELFWHLTGRKQKLYLY